MTLFEIAFLVLLCCALGFAFYRLGERGRMTLAVALAIVAGLGFVWINGVEAGY